MERLFKAHKCAGFSEPHHSIFTCVCMETPLHAAAACSGHHMALVGREGYSGGFLNSCQIITCRLSFGGSLIRPEATGYGLVYFVQNMLQDKGDSFQVRDHLQDMVLIILCTVVLHTLMVKSRASLQSIPHMKILQPGSSWLRL